jgi:hypothetical protein
MVPEYVYGFEDDEPDDDDPEPATLPPHDCAGIYHTPAMGGGREGVWCLSCKEDLTEDP